MAIKATLKSLDGLSDALKALYRKDGEQFILDVEGSDGWELVGGGLTSALKKVREEAKDAAAQLEAFKGIDPVKARDALEKVKTLDNWTPSEKANELIEKRGKDVAAAKDAEYAPKLKRADAIHKAYESLAVTKALEEAAAKHKFIVPSLAPKLFREHVALDEKDGIFTPVIVGQDGKPITKINTKDGSTVPLSIDEFVAQKAREPEYAPLIAGNKATGTGGTVPQTPHQPKADTMAFNYEEQGIERLMALNSRAS